MEFAFDLEKSRTNKIKHGIDFIGAQLLWEDSGRVEIPAKTEDEIRLMVVGLVGNTHWSEVITCRNDKTRVISARRSQREEIQIYES